MLSYSRTLSMTSITATAFFGLVRAKRGHFLLESGHHSALWLDLDPLFVDPGRIAPFVAALADVVRAHGVAAVCGPLVGGAFLAQLIAHELSVDFAFTERVSAAPSEGLYRVRYRLPPSLAERLRGRRVALVDDVMSAGSALRGTYAELLAHSAMPVVCGALLVLGTVGASFFEDEGVPVEAIARDEYELWLPDACPLCAAGVPLQSMSA